MNSNFNLSRRTMLRGLGVSMALPLLDAMLPAGGLLRAAEAAGARSRPRARPVAPLRMCMAFLPNGMAYKDWVPTGEGTSWELSKTLAPLAKVKDDISVLSGLALENAKAKGDGPGDHARSAAAFLTGAIRTRPRARTSRSASRWTRSRPRRSATRPASRRWSWAWTRPAPRATATAATPARTSRTSPGGARTSRCRTRSIPARCSTGCSARSRTARPRRASPSG